MCYLVSSQVSYHLRFSYTPKNAPSPERTELNPNNDLDWHTGRLFPLFQLPGPREQHDRKGGTPGEPRTHVNTHTRAHMHTHAHTHAHAYARTQT